MEVSHDSFLINIGYSSNQQIYSKHMDKHDRPYVCKKSECSSLQGFTYSGGLLRHQREVHNLHGGAKLKLFCEVVGCKRSKHTPFTRRENLAEHMRRVHKMPTPEPTSPKPAVTFLSPKTDEDMKKAAKAADADVSQIDVKQNAKPQVQLPAMLEAKQHNKQAPRAIKPANKLNVKPAVKEHITAHNFTAVNGPPVAGVQPFLHKTVYRPIKPYTTEEATKVNAGVKAETKNVINQEMADQTTTEDFHNSATLVADEANHDTPMGYTDTKKRKRDTVVESSKTEVEVNDDGSWREVAKRLKAENEELKKAHEASNDRMARLEKQLTELVSVHQHFIGRSA